MTEKELIKRCCKNDPRAQQELYEKYAPKMYGVCFRYVCNREVAQDLLHDGFITVFLKIGSFRHEGSFEGWMRRIFVNTALMRLRKGDVLRGAAEVEQARNVSDGIDLLSGIGGKDIVRMIGRMPDGFRTVFNMSVIEGYTHQEIAKELGISEGTSRSQLSRARTWLQERLLEEKKNRR